MATVPPWVDIDSITVQFSQSSNPCYPNSHKYLNKTYGQDISGTNLDVIFEDNTRATLKKDALANLRTKIVELMERLAIQTTNLSLVQRYTIDMPISSQLNNNTKHWRTSADIAKTLSHARLNNQKDVQIILDIDGLHFRPATSPADFFDPKRFEDISTVPFPLTGSSTPPITNVNTTPSPAMIQAIAAAVIAATSTPVSTTNTTGTRTTNTSVSAAIST